VTSRRFTTVVRAGFCLWLMLLFVAPEPVQAGLFGRCGQRKPLFSRCRPCQPCQPCGPLAYGRSRHPLFERLLPQPPPTHGACDGKMCFMEEVVQYFENGVCSFSTYQAIDCTMFTYIYADHVCNHALDNCWRCVDCVNASGFGGTPTLGAAEMATTHGRRYSRDLANRGVTQTITGITVKSPNYDSRRIGVFSVRTPQGEKRVELHWVYLRTNEKNGFGVGYEIAQGAPIEALPAQAIGAHAVSARHGQRVYNVYLKRN
jgi:hypothetical protein